MWRNRCLTGEPTPVAKASGEKVSAASLNRSAQLQFFASPCAYGGDTLTGPDR